MSLEERTLVVRNLCQQITRQLLLQLFNQAGPVVNVVLRPDFAFIEFEHKVSVGYSLALLEGIHLFGQQLVLEPKLRSDSSFYSFKNDLDQFNHVMSLNPNFFFQYMPNDSVRDLNRSHNRENHNQWSDRRQSYPQRNRYDSSYHRKRHSNNFRDFY